MLLRWLLSLILGEAKLTAEHMENQGPDVTLGKSRATGFCESRRYILSRLRQRSPAPTNAKFQELAAMGWKGRLPGVETC